MGKVNITHRNYDEYQDRWIRCRDTFEGTDAVKDKGTTYLPKLGSHELDGNNVEYEKYVLRALYFNAMGRTVEGLSGFIFQKPPIVEVPKVVEKDLNDITMTGIDFDTFALNAGRELLMTGRYGILVDMLADDPDHPTEDAKRAYWSGYEAENILNWRTERRGDDPSVLTRVVLREWDDEVNPEDEFEVLHIEQWRVLELSDEGYSQTLYRRNNNTNKFHIHMAQMFPDRRGDRLDRIPFECLGPTSLSCDVAKPPLIDMVDVNLSHYRTMADLEHGRHFTALPTPWVAGMKGDDPFLMGSAVAWDLDVGGSAGMIEFSGAGLASLVIAEQDKRKMMAILGARLLEEAPNQPETATAFIGRHSGEGATLRTMTAVMSRGFTRSMQQLAWWVGLEEELEEVKASVELNKEFMNLKMNSQEVQAQLQLFQAEAISYATFYHNITLGGWTRPGVDAAKELKQIEKEDVLPEPPPVVVAPVEEPVVEEPVEEDVDGDDDSKTAKE